MRWRGVGGRQRRRIVHGGVRLFVEVLEVSPHVVDRLDRSYALPAGELVVGIVARTGRRPGKSPSLIVATLSTASSHDPVWGRRSPLSLESRNHDQVSVAPGSHIAGETPPSRGGLLIALHLQGRQNTLLQRTGVQRGGELVSVCGANPSRESLHGAGKSSGVAATLSYSGRSKQYPQRDSNPCFRLERAAS